MPGRFARPAMMGNSSLLTWWILTGGGLDRLPFVGPQPEPWRQQLTAALAILDISTLLPHAEGRQEIRKLAVAQLHAALKEIPPA